LTIVYGALRRGEVAALEVDDVRPLGRYWILDLSEDAQGSDYVRIPEVVVEAIERMKDAYDITKGALWRSRSNQNRGAPMSPDAIYKVIRRVAGQAGLDSVSIDELRRTGLQLALEGGATLPQVRAHGRFNDSTSVARFVEERSSELGASAIEHIELETGDLTSQNGD
jgi:integrase